MDIIQKHPILDFPPKTLHAVRKMFDLDQPGAMSDAIRILNEWVKMQKHFMRTTFDERFLENIIITSKGSVERAKHRLDKYCTMKTLLPRFYEISDPNCYKHNIDSYANICVLPKFNSNYERVGIAKFYKNINTSNFMDFYRYEIAISEYLKLHDYSVGMILVLDYRDTDLVEFIRQMSIVDLRQALSIFIEAYGLRIKGIHFITGSKLIETIVSITKQMLSPKLGDRMVVHNKLETLYDYIPKEMLPQEYGGNERSLTALHDEWYELISSKEHVEYLEEVKKRGSDESYRAKDDFNENYMGMPGTFRTLSVD